VSELAAFCGSVARTAFGRRSREDNVLKKNIGLLRQETEVIYQLIGQRQKEADIAH
jgi:hypothetical protein